MRNISHLVTFGIVYFSYAYLGPLPTYDKRHNQINEWNCIENYAIYGYYNYYCYEGRFINFDTFIVIVTV